MDKTFYLEVYNYKYNSWLPIEIIDKLDDKVVKVRCYVYGKKLDDNGNTVKFLQTTIDTCVFWKHIRPIKNDLV